MIQPLGRFAWPGRLFWPALIDPTKSADIYFWARPESESRLAVVFFRSLPMRNTVLTTVVTAAAISCVAFSQQKNESGDRSDANANKLFVGQSIDDMKKVIAKHKLEKVLLALA